MFWFQRSASVARPDVSVFGGGGVVIRGGRRGQGLREGGGVEAGKCPGGLGFEGVVFGADAGFGMCFA